MTNTSTSFQFVCVPGVLSCTGKEADKAARIVFGFVGPYGKRRLNVTLDICQPIRPGGCNII